MFFFLSGNAQRAQYEEWLQETQQLLQMQQKFLEEKIGAHRKSKKALSAKQRTAKKAGREFPEEDAEQLKHVTEQQGVVQKQLEQVTIPRLLSALRIVSMSFCLCLFSPILDKQVATKKHLITKSLNALIFFNDGEIKICKRVINV